MYTIKKLVSNKFLNGLIVLSVITLANWHLSECGIGHTEPDNTVSVHYHSSGLAHQHNAHGHRGHSESQSEIGCCSDNPCLTSLSKDYVSPISVDSLLTASSENVSNLVLKKEIIHLYKNLLPSRFSILLSYFSHAPPSIS
jgi:hypothetical protein